MFTYIIPFKFSEDRFLTLQKVINNIKELECEVIIIEQGTQSILPTKEINLPKYIFLENHYPFNKSWALNCAWKEASHDIIVFGDADNLIQNSKLLEVIENMGDYDFVSPHIRLIDLTEEENLLSYQEIFSIERHGRGELDHQKLPMCGGTTIFKKEALKKIGGWPEEFFGWGAEDDAMSIKVRHFLKWKEIDNNCYHLYHKRIDPDMNWYKRNILIYTNYMRAPKEALEAHIEKEKHLIGNKNRKFA